MPFSGKRFEESRKAFGSMQKLVDAMAVLGESATTKTISEWELPTANPTAKKIAVAAKILNVTVAYLFDEIDDPSPEALRAIRSFEQRVKAIETLPSRANVDYNRAQELGLSADDVLAKVRESDRRLQLLEMREEIDNLTAELTRIREGKNK